ncbi:MAG: ferrous iron transport protein B [Clostridiales bacterium]|jgi:ferrous iron transport protein B|nr:ferrous iron transport protein B [Clostridiales bacterium]
MTIALAGNQNSGKTTLFNLLTGSNQHVGNFPGVTVERKIGALKAHRGIAIADLPGIYSLSPFTQEERVARDCLLNNKPDGIINIVDATNMERGLYLSLQLIELGIPMVIALNMMDELEASGGAVNSDKLSQLLRVPVAPISALKNEGVEKLLIMMLDAVESGDKPKSLDFYAGPIRRAMASASLATDGRASALDIPVGFAASKIIEGDEELISKLGLSEKEMRILNGAIRKLEDESKTDRDAALADARYAFIEKICSESVVKSKDTKALSRSILIDKLLTHKALSLPIFFCIMLFVFWISFNMLGNRLNGIASLAIRHFSLSVDSLLYKLDVNPIIHSLVVDGALAGIGSVLSFLPTIAVLFFCLSLLEDSGYMARITFVMDRLLRRIGLSGRSIVPLLIGFGCSVPAIMSARTLGSESERRMAVQLIPFISCSAKLPIYAVFISAFFAERTAGVMFILYAAGILSGILYAFLRNRLGLSGKSSPFVMELPPYRMPSAKNTGLLVWDKTRDFLYRAFTIIFLSSVVVWFLQAFDFRLNPVSDSENSMLASIGKLISPIFAPLGFEDWRASTALIAGFTAKEAVVSSLGVLAGEGGIRGIFTPQAAFSFLLFTLLYTPCVAAIAMARKELGSAAAAAKLVAFQTTAAYFMAFLFFQSCKLFWPL